LFHDLFRDRPDLVFQLAGDNSPRNGSYGFDSPTVKESTFSIDGVLTPPPYASDLPIVFVEVQGYRENKKNKSTENFSFYHRFFTEINLYLNDYQPVNNWRAIAIFLEKRLDPKLPEHYSEYDKNPRLTRVYLNRLDPKIVQNSLEIEILGLIGTKPAQVPKKAQEIANKVYKGTDAGETERIIELLVKTLVYKLPDESREEIKAMLQLDLKNTRFYKEIAEETLSLAIPALLRAGLSVEQIAVELKTDVPTVERLIKQAQN